MYITYYVLSLDVFVVVTDGRLYLAYLLFEHSVFI